MASSTAISRSRGSEAILAEVLDGYGIAWTLLAPSRLLPAA